MGTPRFRLLDATLNPPVLSAAEEDAAASQALPWVLLEVEAYVAKRENATTAYSQTWNRKQIQVTLCPRRPPRVSYLCVHSLDAEIPVEPEILATEDDLVLLRISIGRQEDVMDNLDYYVYQADDGSGRPALTHLPRLPSPYSFDLSDMGIMRCRTDDQDGIFLRPHCSDDRGQEFVVAGLCEAPDDYPEGNFMLCLYKSKDKVWTKSIVSLNEQQRRQYGSDFEHVNSKVIAIGGGAGTMGFVDLWRGILFCDVLQEEGEAIPPLRYVPLPVTHPKKKLNGEACLSRDIAVIDGRLKYVELQLHWKNSVVVRGARLKDGWIATTYSRAATSSLEDIWSKDYEVDSNYMDFEHNPLTKLLPKKFNDEGMFVDKFLLWKTFPLCCLRWILHYAVFECPPSSATETLMQRTPNFFGTLQSLVSIWSRKEFVQSYSVEQQAYITAAIGLCLEKLTKKELETAKDVLNSILQGVSCRLESPIDLIWKMASAVALTFSKVVDPKNPLYLDDNCCENVDWEFGILSPKEIKAPLHAVESKNKPKSRENKRNAGGKKAKAIKHDFPDTRAKIIEIKSVDHDHMSDTVMLPNTNGLLKVPNS